MIDGIDVSNNNGLIAWGDVAQAGKAFAMLKASEGTSFVDSYLQSNALGARMVGMEYGYYHFGRPALNKAISEAEHFWTTIAGTIEDGQPIALDLEDDPEGYPLGDLGAWAIEWCTRVEQIAGCKPLLYSSPGFMAAHGLQRPELADNGLWLASWGLSAMPRPPAPWTVLAMWQTGVETCPGVSGPCDLDVFNGGREQFRAYGRQRGDTGGDPGPGVSEPPETTIQRVRDRLADIVSDLDTLLGS